MWPAHAKGRGGHLFPSMASLTGEIAQLLHDRTFADFMGLLYCQEANDDGAVVKRRKGVEWDPAWRKQKGKEAKERAKQQSKLFGIRPCTRTSQIGLDKQAPPIAAIVLPPQAPQPPQSLNVYVYTTSSFFLSCHRSLSSHYSVHDPLNMYLPIRAYAESAVC